MRVASRTVHIANTIFDKSVVRLVGGNIFSANITKTKGLQSGK
jgi:hypothetical protein